MLGHLLLLPTVPWTIYVSLDFCVQVFRLKTKLFTPILRVEKKKKQQLDIDPKKKYSRRMMRKQHIFWSASPNYSKPRQISFKKFGFGPWHAGGKLFPMKKRKIGKAFKDDIMTSRKKNCFSKFYGKVGVISWLHLHIHWKDYILYWE